MDQPASKLKSNKERAVQEARLEELQRQLREAQDLIAAMSEAAQQNRSSDVERSAQQQCWRKRGADDQFVERPPDDESPTTPLHSTSEIGEGSPDDQSGAADQEDALATDQGTPTEPQDDVVEIQTHPRNGGSSICRQSSMRMTLSQLMVNSLQGNSSKTRRRFRLARSTTSTETCNHDSDAGECLDNSQGDFRSDSSHSPTNPTNPDCRDTTAQSTDLDRHTSSDVPTTVYKQTLVVEPPEITLEKSEGADEAEKGTWRASFINSLLGNDSPDSLSLTSDCPTTAHRSHSPSIQDDEPDGLASALRVAAENGQLACLQLMINQGADVNGTVLQSTALHAAAAAGKDSCVKALLQAGAQVLTTDRHRRTALQLAVDHGHKDCVRVLLEQETGMETVDKLYHAALEKAKMDGNAECVQLLRQYLDQSTAAAVQSPSSDTTLTSADSALESDLASTSPSPDHAPKPTATMEDKVLENHTIAVYLERSQGPSSRVPGFTKTSHRLLVGDIEICKKMTWAEMETSVWQLLHQHWSDLCVTPTIHSAQSYIYLSRSMQALFGEKLNAITRHGSSRNSSGEQMKSPNRSGSLGSQPSSVVASTMSLSQLSVAHIDDLGLGADSVLEYWHREISWSPCKGGKSSSAKSPLEMWSGHDEMNVRLKGIEQGRLDKLAYESLIPVGTLTSYLEKILQQHQILLSGPPSSGKSFLSSNLAYCLQCQLRQQGQKTDLLRVSLTGRAKEQDKILAMLHDRGLLLADDGSLEDATFDTERSCILLVHSCSGSAIQQALAELLSCIHGNDSIWVGGSSDEQLPRGLYRLRGGVYLLVTLDSTGPVGLDARSWHWFFHLRWRWDSEPLAGLLWRHLLRRKWSPNQAPAELTTASWVCSIWQRINKLFTQISLQHLTIGPTSFMTCPVNGSIADVASWLVDMWNGRIVPAIEGTLQQDGNGHLAEKVLLVLVQLAFLPGCPLPLEEQASWLQSLHIGIDQHEVSQLLNHIHEAILPIEEMPRAHRDLPSPSVYSAESSVFELRTPGDGEIREVEIKPVGWPGSDGGQVTPSAVNGKALPEEKGSQGSLMRRLVGLRNSGRFSRASSPSGSNSSGHFRRKKKTPAKKEENEFFDIISRLQNNRLDSQRSTMPTPAAMLMAKPLTLPAHAQARHTAQRHPPASRASNPRRTSMSNMEVMTGCTPVGTAGKQDDPYRLTTVNHNYGAPRIRLNSLPLRSSH